MRRAVLLAGPTASGKSGLALALARRLGGAVINADSQQVYAEWRVLTARPTAEDEAQAPHMLYGNVSITERYSVGRWLDEAEGALRRCTEASLTPIITGGTGLFFRALTEGLAPLPPIPAEVRAEAEARLTRLGPVRFAEELQRRDPATAAGLDRQNPARLLRAWEVLEATGQPLAEWQAQTPPPLLPLAETHAFALLPPRTWLYPRCDARFDAMLAKGALEEVREVLRRGLHPSLPGMKAVGAPELARHLTGDMTLEQAAEQARTATRRYAKRQMTWIRGQMRDWQWLEQPEAALPAILAQL